MPNTKRASTKQATKPTKRPRTRQNDPVSVETATLASHDASASGEVPLISNTNFVDFESVFRQTLGTDTGLPENQFNSVPFFNSDSTPSPVHLGSDEVSAHVPLALKQKVWSNQFFNFALLLKGSVELSEIFSYGNIVINERGQMESRPKAPTEKITSSEKWTDAFVIFMSIYLVKYPDKVQELLQYMVIIREAASRSKSFAWRSYDEQFRIRQAANLQPWDKLNYDLWLRIMTNQLHEQQPIHTMGKGSCIDFNKGTCSWKQCKFPHSCSHCGLTNHGKSNCFKLNPSRGGHSFRGGRGYHSQGRGGNSRSGNQ